MGRNAECKRATIQKPNITLGTPSNGTIMTTETLELLLSKLPEEAREAFRAPDIPHNLIAACELVDAGCSIHFYKHGCEIEFEGETLYRGWRDTATRLWRIALTSEGGERLTPYTAPEEYDPSIMMTYAAINYQVNSVYECQNKQQLIKYYHASLGSHPKTTLITAAKAGYLKGCPGLTAKAISK